MNELMSKGLLIYTAGLLLAAIMAFVLSAPQLSALAGMAVTGVIVGIMATGIGRDLRPVETTSATPK